MKTHRTEKKRGKFGIGRQHFLLLCLDMTTQTQPPPKFVGAAWPWREHARHKIKPLGWTLEELMSPHLCLLITSGKRPIPPQVSMEFFSCVQSTATDMLVLSPASHLANSRNITGPPSLARFRFPSFPEGIQTSRLLHREVFLWPFAVFQSVITTSQSQASTISHTA